MMDMLKQLVQNFYPFAKKRLGFKKPVSLFFKPDFRNAQNPLGKTAHYDPETFSVTIYTANRHPKDIMRSFSHELVHHSQNCRGEFDEGLMGETGEGYAQENDHLREMEREAYEEGNLCFRDWEDGIKTNKITLKVMTEACQKAEKELIKEQGVSIMSNKGDLDVIKQTIQEVLNEKKSPYQKRKARVEKRRAEDKENPPSKEELAKRKDIRSRSVLKHVTPMTDEERAAMSAQTDIDTEEAFSTATAPGVKENIMITKEELEKAIQIAIKEAVATVPPLNPEAAAAQDIATDLDIEEPEIPANTPPPPPVMAEEEKESLQENFLEDFVSDEQLAAWLPREHGRTFVGPESQQQAYFGGGERFPPRGLRGDESTSKSGGSMEGEALYYPPNTEEAVANMMRDMSQEDLELMIRHLGSDELKRPSRGTEDWAGLQDRMPGYHRSDDPTTHSADRSRQESWQYPSGVQDIVRESVSKKELNLKKLIYETIQAVLSENHPRAGGVSGEDILTGESGGVNPSDRARPRGEDWWSGGRKDIQDYLENALALATAGGIAGLVPGVAGGAGPLLGAGAGALGGMAINRAFDDPAAELVPELDYPYTNMPLQRRDGIPGEEILTRESLAKESVSKKELDLKKLIHETIQAVLSEQAGEFGRSEPLVPGDPESSRMRKAPKLADPGAEEGTTGWYDAPGMHRPEEKSRRELVPQFGKHTTFETGPVVRGVESEKLGMSAPLPIASLDPEAYPAVGGQKERPRLAQRSRKELVPTLGAHTTYEGPGGIEGIESEKLKQSVPAQRRVATGDIVREEVEALEEKTKTDSPDRSQPGHPEDRLKPLEEAEIEEGVGVRRKPGLPPPTPFVPILDRVPPTGKPKVGDPEPSSPPKPATKPPVEEGEGGKHDEEMVTGELYEETEDETLEEWKNRTMYEGMLKRFKIGK